MRALRSVRDWLEERLGLAEALRPLLRHPVPKGLGWWYVFGSATLILFLLQAVTGVCLTAVYVPSTAHAYASLQHLNQDQPLGWFLRAVHYWGASAMVVVLALHMTRVFLMGAYRHPRELTWLLGVVLLLLTLGMAFTGQTLRWDQDAYWAVGVGAAMAARTPLIGQQVVQVLLGGAHPGGETLSRFFTLHVFVVPGLLVATLAVHLFLVLRLGISARPVPGERVDPDTERADYDRLLEEQGEPFFPGPAARDAIACSLVVVAVLALGAVFGPKGPGAPPDPTLLPAEPRPDWMFMWLFALMALLPAKLESIAMLGLPPLLVAGLVAVPFLGRRGERSWRRRPLAVLGVLCLYVGFGVLTQIGFASPWSPHMDAWSGDPVPPQMLAGRTPLELQGAVLFQEKTCRDCHALDGHGGRRGPDLSHVGAVLDHDLLVKQVLRGSGLMPAYGKQLDPDEVEALVAFLQTLRPPGEAAPRPAAR